MASAVERLALAAPLTGTLRYPLDSLIQLGRLILLDYQSHLEAIEDAAADDKISEATESLADVKEVMWVLDRKRWKEEEEKARGGSFPEYTENAKEMEALNDPRQAEKSLLIMGANHKAEYVIPAAVKLRRETRGELQVEGGWKNEDALLDLLEFISKNAHSGLFRALED
ncbi:hypothetical protein CPB84DRAFT_1796278 [Gymnopilus junonius]|uniref:Uncharacterized protein n=1 Tax=Gymnopilus junonius TaxID=109634 RepID=A0A9P5TFU6_GYMJU|nr:hypothetical protein CPB84DRAFT_1796278 [Gymnopilus junonius]